MEHCLNVCGKHSQCFPGYNDECDCRVSQTNVKHTLQCYGTLELLKKKFAFFFPLNDFGQLADHYCHWFVELPFSRMSESTTGYTFIGVWDLLLPLA